MISKLAKLEEKFNELEQKVSDPEIIANQPLWQKHIKEHAELKPIIDAYREYRNEASGVEEAKEVIETTDDAEFKEVAKMQLSDSQARMEELKNELKILLLPKDPNDERNVIVEIRAGAGGDEAGLFAAELQRLYIKYAENRRWSVDIMNTNETGVGGIKEVVFMISGKGAYSRLKYESGIHRVQRVPQTESQGRVHTSTATVAVLPEVDDVEIHVADNDIRVDVYRSSGNGGQSVNTTDSAVRITHLPTGLIVTCQDGKSQLSNKEKAMQILKSRLYEMEMQKQQDEIAADRKAQVGTGDRSGKIRTYNFPQGRVTDHRIPITLYKLAAFMDADIDEMVDALITHFQTELLAQVGD
ncbi:MAG: peptide chain release factor 1 [Bacillota bacterium]|nr:peptide chain release factor 1 [Bacillota bacterium]